MNSRAFRYVPITLLYNDYRYMGRLFGSIDD